MNRNRKSVKKLLSMLENGRVPEDDDKGRNMSDPSSSPEYQNYESGNDIGSNSLDKDAPAIMEKRLTITESSETASVSNHGKGILTNRNRSTSQQLDEIETKLSLLHSAPILPRENVTFENRFYDSPPLLSRQDMLPPPSFESRSKANASRQNKSNVIDCPVKLRNDQRELQNSANNVLYSSESYVLPFNEGLDNVDGTIVVDTLPVYNEALTIPVEPVTKNVETTTNNVVTGNNSYILCPPVQSFKMSQSQQNPLPQQVQYIQLVSQANDANTNMFSVPMLNMQEKDLQPASNLVILSDVSTSTFNSILSNQNSQPPNHTIVTNTVSASGTKTSTEIYKNPSTLAGNVQTQSVVNDNEINTSTLQCDISPTNCPPVLHQTCEPSRMQEQLPSCSWQQMQHLQPSKKQVMASKGISTGHLAGKPLANVSARQVMGQPTQESGMPITANRGRDRGVVGPISRGRGLRSTRGGTARNNLNGNNARLQQQMMKRRSEPLQNTQTKRNRVVDRNVNEDCQIVDAWESDTNDDNDCQIVGSRNLKKRSNIQPKTSNRGDNVYRLSETVTLSAKKSTSKNSKKGSSESEIPVIAFNLNNAVTITPTVKNNSSVNNKIESQLPVIDLTNESAKQSASDLQIVQNSIFPRQIVPWGRTSSSSCGLCSALNLTSAALLNHCASHSQPAVSSHGEMAIPLINLDQPGVLQKLPKLGIQTCIPLVSPTAGGNFAFPIVPVDAAVNLKRSNLSGLGVSSVLSLGPIRYLP